MLFVGNIPYDTTKQDLTSHFNKVGNIVHIRIPTEKGSNRPRGFAYVEVDCETAYQVSYNRLDQPKKKKNRVVFVEMSIDASFSIERSQNKCALHAGW